MKYGRLTVIDPEFTDGYKVLCRCDCGVEKTVLIYNLKSGNTVSCGCKKKANLSKLVKSKVALNKRLKAMISKEEIDKLALEEVIMNEELCFHGATFTGEKIMPAFANPTCTWRFTDGDKSIRASVRCPLCRAEYMEASKRLGKELYSIYKKLHKE